MLIGVLILAGLCGQNLPAAPNHGEITVGTCEGPNSITTIQAGVTAASPGAIVEVCPGVYPEQVTINKPLTLIGIQVGTSDAAVIVPPAGGLILSTTRLSALVAGPGQSEFYQILITATTGNVNLINLTVDGSGNNLLKSCSFASVTLMTGIYYHGASGTVTNVAMRNQVIDPSGNCGSGDGILIESAGVYTSPVKTSVTVQESSVRAYQSAGISAGGFGVAATIKGNTVAGATGFTTPDFGQVGIQVVGGTGSVLGNSVAEIGGPNNTNGILGVVTHGIVIAGNNLSDGSSGILLESDDFPPDQANGLYGDADDSKINSNVVYDTPGTLSDLIVNAGIVVCSNKNQVLANEINGSAGAAIFVNACFNSTFTSTGNTIDINQINEACAGILLATTPNSASINLFQNVFETVANTSTCTAPAVASAASAASVEGSTPRGVRRPMP